MPALDYSKWKAFIEAEEAAEASAVGGKTEYAAGEDEDAALQAMYADALAKEQQADQLRDLKIKIAVDAYERRRPADKVMHHYWVKEAGDPDAVGEYFPTGDIRGGVPVYRNQHGVILSRERQPRAPDNPDECWAWILGALAERRPLYGVQTEDLSVPSLGWQCYTAPEPLPVVRYYTDVAAARRLREQGGAAFQRMEWAKAEECYGKALSCNMDTGEYSELYGSLLSNRAEVRLRLGNFGGAVEDAESALKYLSALDEGEDSVKLLQQKAVVRLVKALQAQRMFPEAARILQDALRKHAKSPELARLLEDSQLALGAAAKAPAPPGATPEMLSFAAKLVQSIQQEVLGMDESGLSERAFPADLSTSLKKLAYLLSKAKSLQQRTDCLSSLQAVVRTEGGLRVLLQAMQAQWQAHLDGKAADAYKLQAACLVASVVSLSCSSCPESLRVASAELHIFWSLLGGCNRKVEKEVCERLIDLSSGLWEHCRAKSIEALQSRGTIVQAVASFLSRACVAKEAEGAIAGTDAPLLDSTSRGAAASLLTELLGCGGRVERWALHGAAAQLAGSGGQGFLSSGEASVRELGKLVISKVVAEPQVVSAFDIRNFLVAVQSLLGAGPLSKAPASEAPTMTVKDGDTEATMRFVALDAWQETEEGKVCGQVLQIIAKALEFRLLLKDRELERDNFENAFHAAKGLTVLIPLLQAPEPLAEPAMSCLSVMCQAGAENVDRMVRLSAVRALLGLPFPESRPMPCHVAETLRSSPTARRCAAKILARAISSQVVMELLRTADEPCIKELVKLASRLREDGASSDQAFQDMLHVFDVISEQRPGLLCRSMPENLLCLLVDMARRREESDVSLRARAMVQIFLQERTCKRRLAPIIKRAEEGWAYDPEEELQQEASSSLMSLMGK